MGIPRLRMPSGSPSRSTVKLAEAMLEFVPGREFEPGLPAVDLGASPGGWTWQLVQRGFMVTAVDNGPMDAALLESGQVKHRRDDGFHYRPADPVSFAEPVYAASVGDNYVFRTATLRYNYQSLASPPAVFDYDMTTRRSTLVKRVEVPGGFDVSNYRSERVMATASDGTKIPISLVYRNGTRRDGSAPMLLYAYGSYGVSIAPTFSATRLPLLDRGAVYAIAHIRGGGELGEPWRDAGRMMNKINTFTDFIASAEYLIAQKYTSADRLVIQGRSAGGMLMGAVTNMRPDLFRAAIAEVPFVDILSTMLDATLPLTTGEYIEWGNPNEKPAYDYMAKYSPYDNVKAQAYPSMLVKVSVNDSQVPYWEGSKLVAKLRATKTDPNPVLLKVNFGAGHGGASGRYDALHETAFNWVFVLWQMGLDGEKPRTQSILPL